MTYRGQDLLPRLRHSSNQRIAGIAKISGVTSDGGRFSPEPGHEDPLFPSPH